MKKRIALILVGAILFGALSGCSEQKPVQEQEEVQITAPIPAEVPETEPEETNVLDTLPENDFGGRSFTVLLRTDKEYEFYSEELSGEIINDSVYERNNILEGRYNVSVGYVDRIASWGSGDRFNPELNSMIMSGDSSFDIVAGYAAMILGAIQKGLFLNWYDMPYIDISKPYWSPQIADSLTINNKMFAMTGDISLSIWEDMICMYFNQKLAQDYSVGDIYELVRNGDWTFDELLSRVRKVSSDLNGDGSYTEDDLYGYVSYWSTAIDSYLPAFDIQVVKRGEDGWHAFTMNTERMVSALEKMQSLFFDGSNSAMMTATINVQKIFQEDRALFYANDLRSSALLRDMETDYGIVPYPKFDSAQAKYHSTSTDDFSLILFPSTVTDLDFVGCITEAMCAVNSAVVVPAYYDIALKDKYNRDQQSAEMLDIIRENLIFDVGYLNSYALNSAGHLFVQLVREGQIDFASSYARNEKIYKKMLQKMHAAYED